MNAPLSTSAAAPSGVIARGLYASWAFVDQAKWTWRHFSPKELSCRCGGRHCRGEYFHNPDFLDRLELLRADMGRPLTITSGRRCPGHNHAVGGATRSQHMLAIAADISLLDHNPLALARNAVARGFTGIGFGRSFLHLDMRAERTAFNYPDGRSHWIALFGRDPVVQLQRGWAL